MTGADLLQRMRLLDRELEIEVGPPEGPDVPLALTALNSAQDDFEAMLAGISPNTFESSTGTIQTTPQGETTPWPAGVLRLDRLQALNDQTGLPIYDVLPQWGAGSQIQGTSRRPWLPWLWGTSSLGVGRVAYYWTQGRSIYWAPLPATVQTIRWYGLAGAPDLTAAAEFTYPDHVALPLATVAVRLMRTGVDDQIEPVIDLEQRIFPPVIAQMTRYRRDRAPGYNYRYLHTS